LPAAMAGAIFQAARTCEPFHAQMPAQTPER
jgi:hypothetical protein